jgi:hypothetical protein
MKTITAMALFIILSGCTGSKVIHRWVDPNWKSVPQQRILVVSLINRQDHNWDEKIESHIVGDLKNVGILAVSAYKLFGSDAFNGKDRNTIETSLKDSGYTGYVTIVLLDKKSEQVYVSPSVSPSASRVSEEINSPFGKYVYGLTDRILAPGYFTTTTKYFWETNFYGHPDGNLRYAAQSRSFDPNSINNMAHEFGKLIVKDMLKFKVIAKWEQPPTKDE